jgi:uncharacterized protein (TIGR03437 family)
MYPRQNKFPVAILAAAVLAVASGQTQDSSGNALLKGNFIFRHLAVQNVDENFDPSETTASFGKIVFDGKGNYTITGTSVDNTVAGGSQQTLNVTGTYAIGSNGAGYVSNPLFPTDNNVYLYGAVAQGVYTGSSTEAFGESTIMNDIFVAIPVGAAPTNASFTTPFQSGVLDFTAGGASAIKNALFELNPNGSGGFGTISLTGQASNQFAPTITQSITGATYNFNSDGSATLTIPAPSGRSSNALFTGSKTMFESADGNFILGWTATGYDIFFGVKALTGPASNSISQGLYFTAALEDVSGFSGTDSFYGGISNSGNSAGDGIVHERLNLAFQLSEDIGTDDQIVLNSDGTTGVDLNFYQYIFGAAGQAFVGIGTEGNYSLVVGLHAASFSGAGVFLNPIGVVNAASYQPITASIAPGELLTLFGTGLSAATLTTQGGQTFPSSLGGVSVTIDGLACPIYYVSSTQLSVIVPYGVASNMTGLADIQVTNNGAKSNVVQMYLTDAAPGAFSQNANGIGFAAATHALTGVEITSSNPAQPGEYISLYLTGLGPVTPTVTDGILGPSNPLSTADIYNAGNLAVFFNDFNANGSPGNPGIIQFAGLAPTLAGLYQINIQVPTFGLGAGDNVYLEFFTDAADIDQIQIPYGTSSSRAVTARARRFPASRFKNRKPQTHRVRRGATSSSFPEQAEQKS